MISKNINITVRFRIVHNSRWRSTTRNNTSKMLATALLVLLALGFTHGDQGSTLSKEEIKRYFSVDNEAEAPIYEIVYVQHVSNWKSPIFVTGESIAEASPQFRFQFNNEEVHLTLNQDDSFLAPDFTAIQILSDEGEYWEPIQRDCLYRGYVTKYGSKKSSAQISTCSGMMGAIYRDDDGPLYIEPMTDEDASKRRDISRGLAHIAYGRSPAKVGKEFCEALDTGSSFVPQKDDERKDTRAAKHLDMHVVGDKALYDIRGSNTGTCVTAMMNSVTNGISWLGDLTASMQGMTLITGSNNYGLVPTTNGNTYLDRVISWAKGRSGESAWDVVALMTGLDICGSTCGTLGIAYIGAACNRNYRGSISEMRDYNVVDTQIHETGHNLGCQHDSNGNSCDASIYMMAAYATSYKAEPVWSTCSKSYYSNAASGFTCM